MGLFDIFKKKTESTASSDSASQEVASSEQNSDVPKTDAENGESQQNPQEKSEGGFFSGLKSGIASALKAVGVGGWKARQVKDLQPNFTSEDPLDHVLVLNKAGVAFGGLKKENLK